MLSSKTTATFKALFTFICISTFPLTEVMADDFPNGPETTVQLEVGTPILGSHETALDQDWFRVSLVASVDYQITATISDTIDYDPILLLFADDGNTDPWDSLAMDFTSDPLDRTLQINFTPETDFNGFVAINSAEFSGSYTLSLSEIEPVTDTCDVGGGANDIETVTASYDDGSDEIVVEMSLCADVDSKTEYRVYLDHEDTTNNDGDGIDDGPDTLDPNPDCTKTFDDRMLHKSAKDRGPGTIDIVGSLLTFRVPIDELNPVLEVGDTVLVWADTKLKKVTDKAPNTEPGDGCAKPEVASEVLSVTLD